MPAGLGAAGGRIARLRAVGRVLLVVGLSLIGGQHLYLWFLYFRRVHVIGVLFLVDVVSAALLVCGVAVLRNRWIDALGGVFAVGTLLAFVCSSTFGLFGFHEKLLGHWQIAAGGTEAAVAAIAASLTWSASSLARRTAPPARAEQDGAQSGTPSCNPS